MTGSVGRDGEEGISERGVTTGTSDLLFGGAEGKGRIKNGQESANLKRYRTSGSVINTEPFLMMVIWIGGHRGQG